MDIVSVHDYTMLNCASVIDLIACHARLHLHGITLLDSLSGTRSVQRHASPLEHVCSLVIGQEARSPRPPHASSFSIAWTLWKHVADPSAETRRHVHRRGACEHVGPPPPPPFLQQSLLPWWDLGSLQEPGQGCPGRRSLIGCLGWHSWWWQRSMLLEQLLLTEHKWNRTTTNCGSKTNIYVGTLYSKFGFF